MEEEIWKQIEDFPNYEISTMGNVRNTKTGKDKKPTLGSRGYCRIMLYNNGKEKGMLVHRLVCLAFLENPDNLPQCDHIDNDKTNNKLSNLRWISSYDNIIRQNKNINGKNIHQSGNKYYISYRVKGITYKRTTNTFEEAEIELALLKEQYPRPTV